MVDWNLLPALNALLHESSVSRAAVQVGVTVPSMSRMLARLREVLGDPLLVRAGRELVPTPLALELRERVAVVAGQAHDLLARGGARSLADIRRSLVIRASDGVIGLWVDELTRLVRLSAPHVTLVFVSEGDEDPAELRDGRVELDLGVRGDATPELRTRVLMRDAFVGVVRRGHPWTRGAKTLARFASFEHLGVSHRGRLDGPIDRALRREGLERRVVATVPSATAAVVAAARSDLVTTVPSFLARTLAEVLPIVAFELPLDLPKIAISATWHPRFDADPVHRWVRDCLVSLVKTVPSRGKAPKSNTKRRRGS
jgi:DNA-binding transcriptional LysR family regulator